MKKEGNIMKKISRAEMFADRLFEPHAMWLYKILCPMNFFLVFILSLFKRYATDEYKFITINIGCRKRVATQPI